MRTYGRSFLYFIIVSLSLLASSAIINLHNSSLLPLSGWRRQVTKTQATHANANLYHCYYSSSLKKKPKYISTTLPRSSVWLDFFDEHLANEANVLETNIFLAVIFLFIIIFCVSGRWLYYISIESSSSSHLLKSYTRAHSGRRLNVRQGYNNFLKVAAASSQQQQRYLRAHSKAALAVAAMEHRTIIIISIFLSYFIFFYLLKTKRVLCVY